MAYDAGNVVSMIEQLATRNSARPMSISELATDDATTRAKLLALSPAERQSLQRRTSADIDRANRDIREARERLLVATIVASLLAKMTDGTMPEVE